MPATLVSRPRFIPAGAGNTARSCPASETHTVHPRWRGEHKNAGVEHGLPGGSSPLARGTLPNSFDRRVVWRFIPAGAGNTVAYAPAPKQAAVHPRWRGEHITIVAAYYGADGSSPLARGTLRHMAPHIVSVRFIPAGAGNTKDTELLTREPSVHPRWRGEHSGRIFSYSSRYGSSPLARGTLAYMTYVGVGMRFIPAGAGNTERGRIEATSDPVHPRWRGEHIAARNATRASRGSSPLARGTRTVEMAHAVDLRFIPAGAGNTMPVFVRRIWNAVHPRWRGEHCAVR